MSDSIIKYCSESVEPAPKKSKYDESCKKHDQLFNDPIHGSIELNALEQTIINTPEFYRLKDIKQLGGTVHVYPGATHTRFEHSLGVCYIAGEFVKHLNKKHPGIISKEDEYCIRLAGLCHDLGHGPFSHAFIDVAKGVIKETDKALEHEELSKLIFKKILLDHPVVLATFILYELNVEHVKKIEDMIESKEKINTSGKEAFLYEIVANKVSGMDVDKWDYFARDCHYLGVTNDFDWRRCMILSSIVTVKTDEGKEELHIGYRNKELNNILSMFRIRSSLHQRAYQHSTADGIEMMIKSALVKVKDVKLFCTPDDKHFTLKTAVEEAFSLPDEKSGSDKVRAKLGGYLNLTDTVLDHIRCGIPMDHKDKVDEARDLIERIMKRDHYKCIAEESVPKSFKDQLTKKLIADRKEIIEKIWKECSEQEQMIQEMKLEDVLEINVVTIKMASESVGDPTLKIYLFKKDAVNDSIPEGYHRKKEDISKLNMPQAFIEYKARLYLKASREYIIPDKEEELKEELKKVFKDWVHDSPKD